MQNAAISAVGHLFLPKACKVSNYISLHCNSPVKSLISIIPLQDEINRSSKYIPFNTLSLHQN